MMLLRYIYSVVEAEQTMAGEVKRYIATKRLPTRGAKVVLNDLYLKMSKMLK